MFSLIRKSISELDYPDFDQYVKYDSGIYCDTLAYMADGIIKNRGRLDPKDYMNKYIDELTTNAVFRLFMHDGISVDEEMRITTSILYSLSYILNHQDIDDDMYAVLSNMVKSSYNHIDYKSLNVLCLGVDDIVIQEAINRNSLNPISPCTPNPIFDACIKSIYGIDKYYDDVKDGLIQFVDKFYKRYVYTSKHGKIKYDRPHYIGDPWGERTLILNSNTYYTRDDIISKSYRLMIRTQRNIECEVECIPQKPKNILQRIIRSFM